MSLSNKEIFLLTVLKRYCWWWQDGDDDDDDNGSRLFCMATDKRQ